MANAFDIFCEGLMKGTDEIYSEYNAEVEKLLTSLALFQDALIEKYKSSKANHANTKIKPNQKRKLDGINEEEDEDGSKKRLCPFNEMAAVTFPEKIPALEKPQHSTPNKDIEIPEGDISAIIAEKPRTKRCASVVASALNNKLLNEKLKDKMRRPSSRKTSQQDLLLDKLPYVLLNNTLKQNVLSLPKKNSIVKNGVHMMMETSNVDIVISVNEQDKENEVPETANTTVENVKIAVKSDTTMTLASPVVTSNRSTRSNAANNTTLTLDVSKQKELEADSSSIMPPPMMPVIKPKRGRQPKKNANTTVEAEHSESDCSINITAARKTRTKRKPSEERGRQSNKNANNTTVEVEHSVSDCSINTTATRKTRNKKKPSEVVNESVSRSTRSTRSNARNITELPPPPPPVEKPKRTRTKRGKAASTSNQSELNSETTEIVVEVPRKEAPVTSDSDDEFEHKKVKHVRPKRTRKGKAKLPTTPRPPTPPLLSPPEEQEEKHPSHDATITERMEVEEVEDALPLAPAKVLRSSNRMQTDANKVDSPKVQQLNVSYVVQSKEQKAVLNETVVLEKANGRSRATTVLSSPKQKNLPEVEPAHQVCNETITLSSKPLDQTITINKDELIKCDPNESLLTDDLSEVEETPPRVAAASLPKIITKGFIKLKNVIYNESPVQSRVQHFERLAEAAAGSPRLGLDVADGPTRVTRTKTRAMAAKDTDTEESNVVAKVVAKVEAPPPTRKMSRSKIATPVSAHAIAQLKLPLPVPSFKQTSVKLGHGGGSSESLLSPKPQYFVQNIVREEDAMRKREAMLQARTELQRRKREEKSRAAAQARQQQMMLKQAQLEKMEKEKEERIRQQQIEREERLKEESEKKRIALERRRMEEAQRQQQEDEARREAQAKRKQQEEIDKQRKKMVAEELAAARKLQEMKNQAAAAKMLSKKTTSQRAPTYKTFGELATDDESEEEQQTKRQVPLWTTQDRKKHVKSHAFLSTKDIDKLYSTSNFSPNLVEIFPRIDKKKLVRSSSAHWRTPPRYSMMPKE